MKTSMSDRIARHAKNGRRRTGMIVLFACLALVVGTCVEMALRQRGITLTASSEVLDCHVTGKVAHKHSAECYDSNKKLICQLPERELHKHDKTCYSDDGKLVCGKEEITKEHVHGPGCMRTISAPAEDGGKPKTFTHTFKDKSGTPVVRVDVVAPADALPEGTTMRATWLEESQVDKKLVQEAVTKRSGGKVLQMQAMDISFFDADGNEVEPASEVTVKLMSTIISEANAPMVVHVEDQAEAQERAEEQAANAGVADAKAQTKPEGEVMRQLSSQEMALRDESLAKNQIAFETSDFSTYVIATTSLRHTMHASDNATVTIDVDAPVEAGLPADAKLKIDEIPRDSAEYKQYEAQALQVTGEKTSALARFFNIKIMSGDKEIQPDADVSVSVKLNDAPKADANAEAQVVHFGTKPEVVASREEDGTTQFQTKSFSVYGVMYTVDFEYQGFTYTLPGGRAMLLSELFGALGIDESIDDVTEVTFTNSELLKVEKAGKGVTIQRLLDDPMGNVEGDASSANGEGAGIAATDGDAAIELGGNQDDKLVEVPLAEGEDFEPLPDLVQTIDVAEGDWVLTSLKSFESEETLTVKTKKGVYQVKVTDPPIAPYNPWGPGMGFFGGTASWDLVQLAQDSNASFTVKYDDNKEYDRGDEITFDLTYQINKNGWSDYNPWMGYPTFTYDAKDVFTSNNFKEFKPGKSYLTFGGKKRGTVEVTKEGKIIIQVTDTNWFNTRDEIGGTLSIKLKLENTNGAVNDEIAVAFPTVTPVPKIKVKTKIDVGRKQVTASEPGEDGVTLHYTATITPGTSLTDLKFVDTIGGKQKYVSGSARIDNSATITVTETSSPKGFTGTIGNISGGNTYTITYDTHITKEDYEAAQASGSWETNSCKWVYNGNKELPGGDTSYEIKKPSVDPPTISKSVKNGSGQDINSQSVNPGDELSYELVIEGKGLAGLNFSDNMTDLQTLVPNSVDVKVYDKNNDLDDGATREIRNALQITNSDSTYSTGNTSVINGTVPKGPKFENKNDTYKIVITYKTKVISQETATANGIYSMQYVNNSLQENSSWQQKTTTTKVQYEDQPVTKVSKTASPSPVDGEGRLEHDGTITYTVIIGDGTTTLDGVKVRDYASGDQKINSNFTVTGSNVNITDLGSQLANQPQSWDQTVLDFTFPPGTGKGPVTITYTAQPYADTDATNAKIFGERTLTNKVNTGTDEANTGVKYEYPPKTDDPLVKTATRNDVTAEGNNSDKLDPGETVDYIVYFNNSGVAVNGLSIMDQMTDLQKLTGAVGLEIGTADYATTSPSYTAPTNFATNTSMTTVYGKVGNTVVKFENGKLWYKTGEVEGEPQWAEGMPKASQGWGDDGVTWSYFDDGGYNDNMVRVYNFKFPDKWYTGENMTTEVANVTGVIKITYTTTVITKEEATASQVMGDKTVWNAVTFKETTKQTEVPAIFPKNLNHNPDVAKQFSGWDDDGYTTWWTIDVKADEESSYPLEKLTLTEDWASGSIYYSTDWPVQNFNKNVLADIDLLGAEIVTDSGRTLQPGRDYTIDKEAGSFYFEKLEEAVTIRLAIHNPDATINTFYQHNQVTLRWQKDAHNTGEKRAEATGRRVKQEVDLTKSGKYDPDTRLITWTVIFNPYFKEVAPEMSPIRFTDTLPAGLKLVDGSVSVAIQGNDWITYKPTSGKISNVEGTDGSGNAVRTITIANLDPQERWGNNAKHDMYYWVGPGGAWDNVSEGTYSTNKQNLTDRTVVPDGHDGEIVKDANGNVVGRMVKDVGLGLSKNSYTVTYQTEVDTDEWNRITSSLTGKETYKNNVTIGNGGDQSFSASNKVTVEGKDYLKKYDTTREDDDGYIIDEADLHDNAISYEIDVNPKRLTLNTGRALTLTDRIDTIMELDTDSVVIYSVTGEGDNKERQELSHAQMAAQGIGISYNDDTRILTVSGLADKANYIVAYKAVSRAYGTSTFTNTATLIGGGSHSDKVSDQHAITNDEASFWGNRHGKLELKKIDENDITNKLDDAKFSLYRVRLKNSAETANWTCADWMALLDKVNSEDPAVLAQVAEDFKVDGDPELIASGLTTGPNGGNDPGTLALEYDLYQNGQGVKGNYLKEHVVYFWEEDTPPAGFHVTNPGPHYFVLYIDGELDEDYTKEDQRKKAAWALDDAVTIANGWTVASMSSDTTWKVNNTRDGYTSITATKRWEGDYDNKYETRPTNGILYDLYRVDRLTGEQTLMADLSPVPINDDGHGNWSSYTWYRLDNSYDYTVRERAVPGYMTTYSDGGKGVDGGTVTVTNTYIPKSTDIYVQKKWDPEGGAKPAQVKVSLYKILHEVNADGSVTASEPEYMGDDYTYMLTAADGWKHSWKGLDTSDPDGNTITYTVVEDIDAVNADGTVSGAGTRYGAVYSDGGQGTVDAPEGDPLTITNLANAPGSLKITKKVTVNGEPASDAAADGAYRFRIVRVTQQQVGDGDGAPTVTVEEPATFMHDHANECGNDNASQAHAKYLVGDVTVQVQNGKAASTMVDDLEEGTYRVYEYDPAGGATLAGVYQTNSQGKLEAVGEGRKYAELSVVAGVSDEETAPEAAFVNDVEKNRVKATKKWQSANDGTASWPEGIEVKVQMMKKTVTGEAPNQSVALEEVTGAGIDPVWLTNNRQTTTWDLPSEPALGAGESYVVVEKAIRYRVDAPKASDLEGKTSTTETVDEVSYNYYADLGIYEYEDAKGNKTYYKKFGTVSQTTVNTAGGVETTSNSSTITIDGNTYNYSAEGRDANAGAKGVDYTITNKQVVSVPFKKMWGMEGTDASAPAWPTGESITIQLKQDGQLLVVDANNTDDGIRVLKKVGDEIKVYESDGSTERTGESVTDARSISPTLGGGGYIYTFTGLEKGHTYTVEETKVGENTVNAGTREAGTYISIQEDGTSVRNIQREDQVSFTKQWATGSEPTGGATWSVSGDIVRERRPHGSTLEGAWAADKTYMPHTFSIENNTTGSQTTKNLPKYGYDATNKTMWEYRYSAKETNVTVNGVNVTDAFTASVVRDAANPDSITVTNTLPTTDVYFRKAWIDGSKEVAWPVENGAAKEITFNIVRQSREYVDGTNNNSWSSPGVSVATQVINNSNIQKLDTLQPKYGYENDHLVEYRYVVSENTNTLPAHFSQDGTVTGEGTVAKPYTITNRSDTTSLQITKKWKTTDEGVSNASMWPEGKTVTGTITRKRHDASDYTSPKVWKQDNTYSENFSFTVNDMEYSNDPSTGYTAMISNLSLYGYADGKLWEYGYYDAEENPIALYSTEKDGEPVEPSGSNGGSFTFTNSSESTHMNVTVKKVWKDSDGLEIPASTAQNDDLQATFQLHKVRPAVLTVNVPNVSEGTVTVTVNDGTDHQIPLGKTAASGQGDNYTYTYDSTNGWKITYAPLKKAGYTVTATAGSSALNVSGVNQNVTNNGTSATFTAADQKDAETTDYEVTFASSSTPPSRTITVTANPTPSSGWISVNLYKPNAQNPSNWDFFRSQNLNSSNSWSATFDNLEANTRYKVGTGEMDYNVFDSAYISKNGSPANGEVEAGQNGAFDVSYVQAQSSNRLTVTVPYLVGFSGDGWMKAKITRSGSPNVETVVELNQHNGWTVKKNLDGYSTYEVTLLDSNGVDGTYITNAWILSGAGQFSGSGDHTTELDVSRNGNPTLTVSVDSNVGLTGGENGSGGQIAYILKKNGAAVGSPIILNKWNNWRQVVPLDGNSSSTYTVSNADITYDGSNITSASIKEATNASFVNGTVTFNGNANYPTITLNATKYTAPTTHTLNIKVKDSLGYLTNTDDGEVTVSVVKQGESTDLGGALNKSNTPNVWTLAVPNLENNANYTVTASIANNTYFTDLKFGNGGTANASSVSMTHSASSDTTQDIVVTKTSAGTGGTASITVDAINWPTYSSSDPSGYQNKKLIRLNQFHRATNNNGNYSGGDWAGGFSNDYFIEETSGTRVITGDTSTYNCLTFTIYPSTYAEGKLYLFADKGAVIQNSGNSAIAVGDGQYEFNGNAGYTIYIPWDTTRLIFSTSAFDPATINNNMLSEYIAPIPFLMPRVALAEESESTEYAMVDVTQGGAVILTGTSDNYTNTWTGLDKVDSVTGQSYKYYVVETDVSGLTSYTTTYDKGYDGNDYDPETALGSSGTITVTNTDTSKVKVKVEKVWKDASGNVVDAPEDMTATFQLKRYTNGSSSTGSGTGSVHVMVMWGNDDPTSGSGHGSYVNTSWERYANPGDLVTFLFNVDTGWAYTVDKCYKWNDTSWSEFSYNSSGEYTNENEANKRYSKCILTVPDNCSEVLLRLYDNKTGSELESNINYWNPIANQNGSGFVGTTSAPEYDNTFNPVSVTLSKANNWSASFPKQDSGYTYYVEEAAIQENGNAADIKGNYSVTYDVKDIESEGVVADPTNAVDAARERLAKSGTVVVTNTSTTAKIKVRKQFTDNAGSSLTVTEALGNADRNPEFTLKRYRRAENATQSIANATIILNAYKQDSPGYENYNSWNCHVGDVIRLYWTQSSSPYDFVGHVMKLYGKSSWEDWTGAPCMGAGGSDYAAYDWDNENQNVVEMRIRVEENRLVQLAPEGSGASDIALDISGENRNLYCDFPLTLPNSHPNGGIAEKTVDGIHMAIVSSLSSGGANSDGYTITEDVSWSRAFSINKSDPTNDPTGGGSWVQDSNKDLWLEKTFDNLQLKDGDDTFIYYVDETTKPTGYEVSYSVNGQSVNPNSATNAEKEKWLAQSGTMVVTNKDQRRTSVTATKKWRDGDTDTTAYHESAGHTVTLELFQVTGASQGIDTDGYTNLVMPTGSNVASVVPGQNSVPSTLKNPVILNSNDVQHGVVGWAYKWTGLPTTDGTSDYTYFVKETVKDAQGHELGTSAWYDYDFVSDTGNDATDRASGVASVTIVNRETSVKATKAWDDAIVNQQHAGETVTFELWRALKERGDNPQTGVAISKDALSGIVVSKDDAEGRFARFERVQNGTLPDPEDQNGTIANYDWTASYDFVTQSWNYEWEHLPLVVTETKTVGGQTVTHTYDVTYYVREAKTSEGAASATYGDYVFNDMSGSDPDGSARLNSGVREVRITNHETSLSAEKKWAAGSADHTGATVTLDLYKAVKAPENTEGTHSVVFDETSGLAIPQTVANDGDYVAAVRIDRKVLSYDSTFTNSDNTTGGWHYTWGHLPTVEEFNGEAYELVYFVREAYTTEDGKNSTASAQYTLTFNDPEATSPKDTGVKEAVITNRETSVKASKKWKKNGADDNSTAHDNYTVTYELWKSRKAHQSSSGVYQDAVYGISEDGTSHLQFPTKDAATKTLATLELVEEKTVSQGSNNWECAWSSLPYYETDASTGETYELAYFVREKCATVTEGQTKRTVAPSATYGYTQSDGTSPLSTVDTNGANGGLVQVANDETEVSVTKEWEGTFPASTDTYTATVQLYKARKSLDNTDKNYVVNNNPGTGTPVLPESGANGTIASFEPYGDPVTLGSGNSLSLNHTWRDLPLYETDATTGKTYQLEYYVQETGTNAYGSTATYNYNNRGYNQGTTGERIESVAVKNTAAQLWSVKVNKHWTDGNKGHEGVTMKLTRWLKPDSENESEKQDPNFGSGENHEMTVVLDDSNGWEYTWTGLQPSVDVWENGQSHTYKAAREKDDNGNYTDTAYGTLIYKVEEDVNQNRKDFAVEHKDENDPNSELVWPDYQNGQNDNRMTTYWVVTNKPVYYGRLKITKDFEGIDLAAFAGVDLDSLSAEQRAAQETALENAKKQLKFDITTVDSNMDETGENPKLIRRTWHLVRRVSGGELVWVDEPLQGYESKVSLNSGTYPDKPYGNTEDDATVEADARTAYDAYAARFAKWEEQFAQQYSYVTYADIVTSNGEFQIVDSKTHEAPLGPDLVMDKVYTVSEIGAQGLIANHTLVAGQSTTFSSSPVPKSSEETMALKNTYAEVKGTLRVTKNVTLNGEQKYDDVAAGQTFRIGLMVWTGEVWEPYEHDVTTTETMRLESGETTEVTTTVKRSWIQTVTIGKGSTATAVFDDLPLGRYRAYELSDEFNNGHVIPLYKQGGEADPDNSEPINGYLWEVSETGTYYVLDGSTLKKVDGDGTHERTDKGEWNDVTGGKVRIDGSDYNECSVDGSTYDSGVVLSQGSDDEKSPRNAEITITNNKTETGSIKVNKRLVYNGTPDTSHGGDSVSFGLYREAMKDELADNNVTKVDFKNGVKLVAVKESEIGGNGDASVVRTATFATNSATTDTTFGNLPYTRTYTYTPQGGSTAVTNTESITYHVLELDMSGSPITAGRGEIFKADEVYTVVGGDGPITLDHEDNDPTVSYTNSIKEQGKIVVRKYVGSEDESHNFSQDNGAQGTFRVGLFKKEIDNNGTPDDQSDDVERYVLQQNGIREINVSNGEGTASFERLDFAKDGTNYYVFELDAYDQPVMCGGLVDGYMVRYSDLTGVAGYHFSVPNDDDNSFPLTQLNHEYDFNTREQVEGDANVQSLALVGLTVNNIASESEFQIVKVDRQSWMDARTNGGSATTLPGATFTMRQIEEGQAPVNGIPVTKKVSNVAVDPITSTASGPDGVVHFAEVRSGYYEVTEASCPNGYLLVGDSTFYLKVAGGKVTFLEKNNGNPPSEWDSITANYTPDTNCNVMSYAEATAASGGSPATVATVTVGNVSGTELPSTGGPGLWPLTLAGSLLFLGSVAVFFLDRRRA